MDALGSPIREFVAPYADGAAFRRSGQRGKSQYHRRFCGALRRIRTFGTGAGERETRNARGRSRFCLDKRKEERIPACRNAEFTVRLRVGFFDNREYGVCAAPTALEFVCGEEEFHLPYGSIIRITMSGASLLSEGFVLETVEKTYSGSFHSLEDAKRFLECVGDRMQGRLTLNLSRA